MVLVGTTPGCHQTTNSLGPIGAAPCSGWSGACALEQVAPLEWHEKSEGVARWNLGLAGPLTMTRSIVINPMINDK